MPIVHVSNRLTSLQKIKILVPGSLLVIALGLVLFFLLGPPVRYIEIHHQSRALFIVYSGDGGWRAIDRELAHRLTMDDLSTGNFSIIGIDCLKYFTVARTPDEIARNLDNIIQDFIRSHSVERVVLIGYSFGADIVPFAYNRLSEASRSKVVMLSLLTPSDAIDFRSMLRGWTGPSPPKDTKFIMPELAKIDPMMVQCFYGIEETRHSTCQNDWFQRAEVVPMPGGHHFDYKYEPLAERIRSGLEARLKAKRMASL